MRNTIVALLIWCCSYQVAFAQDVPEANINAGNWIPMNPDSIYPSQLSVAQSGNPNQHTYYLPPFLQYDKTDLQKQFDAQCRSMPSTHVADFRVDVHFSSRLVRSEIEQIIRKNNPLSSYPSSTFLRPYPFQFLQLFFGRSEKIVGYYPPEAPADFERGEPIASTVNFVDEAFPFFFSEACSTIENLLDDRFKLRAKMYSNVKKSTRNEIEISYRRILSSRAFNDLFNNTTKEGSVVIKSSSSKSSAGANLANMFTAGSTSSGTKTRTTDTRRVFVSETYLQDIFQNELAQISWDEVYEGDLPDGLDARRAKTADALITALLSRFQTVSAKFDTLTNNQYVLAGNRITANLTREKISEILKADIEAAEDLAKSVKVNVFDVVEVDSSNNAKFTGKSGISWDRKDGDWIPISANLRSISKAELRNSFSIAVGSTAFDSKTSAQVMRLNTLDRKLANEPEKKVTSFRGNATMPVTSETRVFAKADNSIVDVYFCGENGASTLVGVHRTAPLIYNSENPNTPTTVGPRGKQISLGAKCLPPTREIGGTEYAVTFSPPQFGPLQSCRVSRDWYVWYTKRLDMVGALFNPHYACYDGTLSEFRASMIQK